MSKRKEFQTMLAGLLELDIRLQELMEEEGAQFCTKCSGIAYKPICTICEQRR